MNFSLSRFAFAGWKYAAAAVAIVALLFTYYATKAPNYGATMVIVPGNFDEQVSVSGTVVAAQNVALGFAANGRIAATYARVGQQVGAGTVLAEIENGDLAAAVAQKKATLASLLAGTRPEQVAVAQAAVANAQAALINAIQSAYTSSDDAVHNKADTLFQNPRVQPQLSFSVTSATLKATAERERAALEPVFASWNALASGATSDTALSAARQTQAYLAQVATLLADTNAALNSGAPDQTTTAATLASYATTLATARTNVNAASTAVTNAVSALIDAQKTLTLDEAGPTAADVAAAQADVQNAQAALAKTRVVAPFSGVVTQMDAKVGEIVSPSTSEISMQSDGVFEIETYIPEVSIARVAVGNLATTTLDAYGSAVPFGAKVISVDPAETVKDGVPTYKTTLIFNTADPRIRSGMTTSVLIETGVLTNAIVVPAGAVAKAGTPDAYVTAVEGGKLVNRSVTTGTAPSLGRLEIVTGVSKGDVILLTPST